MLLAHRGIEVPELAAAVFDHGILHSRFRAILQIRRGVTVDDELLARSFERRLDAGRANLMVALSGTVRVRAGGRSHSLEPGGFLTERRDRGWAVRQAGDSAVLILDWESGPLGASPTSVEAGGRLGPGALNAIRLAAACMSRPSVTTEVASRALVGIVDVLRAHGAPVERVAPDDLVEAVSPSAQALNAAADAAIAALGSSPMNVDLEDRLGWSERHIRRQLREYHRRYAYNASGGLRDLVRRWRAVAGTALMTAAGSTTAGVASRLGYATPSAFCHAIGELGLPSPGTIAWEVARLE